MAFKNDAKVFICTGLMVMLLLWQQTLVTSNKKKKRGGGQRLWPQCEVLFCFRLKI